MDELQAMWDALDKRLEKIGHKLIRDEDGKVDYFVKDAGYHNGPGCEVCHTSWCQHCNSVEDVEPCGGPPPSSANQPENDSIRDEIDALRAENERLRAAAIDLRDDLLKRAEWDGEAKVVVAGAGAWFRFVSALEPQQSPDRGKPQGGQAAKGGDA